MDCFNIQSNQIMKVLYKQDLFLYANFDHHFIDHSMNLFCGLLQRCLVMELENFPISY